MVPLAPPDATDGGPLVGRDILVLEDETFIALDLRMAIEDLGATPHLAATTGEALGILSGLTPDAAILDVNLGGKDETCEPVADRLHEMGVPFVIHSGDLRMQGELIDRLGAPVIVKPAQTSVIMDALRAAIAQRPGA